MSALMSQEISRRTFLRKGGLGLSTMALASGTGDLWATASASDIHEARYYRRLTDARVQCQLCFRQCVVMPGRRGFCRNRENRGGRYYTLVYGKPCSLQIDPIEKEPSYHMLPGARIFCTATASCNNRCKFCHNWHISQRSVEETQNYELTPEEVVQLAVEHRCEAMSFTYSEPTVFYEYMFDIARLAKDRGLKVLYHTNGLINEEPLLALLKLMDAVTVDLKAFTSKFYREVCSSELEPVLETLQNIRKTEVHLEVVNLMIPTLNDELKDVRRMCAWIREHLGAHTPLHLNRFSPVYKLKKLFHTPIRTLEQARDVAVEEGLKFVYIGNVPGHTYNSTFCPKCGERLIHRVHFASRSNRIEHGKCAFCGETIPGIWGD